MARAPIPPGGGTRKQRAAKLRAEEERRKQAAKREAAYRATGEPPATTAPTESSQDGSTETSEATATPGPVGEGDYVVREGDCVSSIALETGHFWETIWNDGANAELNEARGNPNVLLPRDRLTIPPMRRKSESGATEVHHRFRRKGVPEQLRIQLLHFGDPRANLPFSLLIDTVWHTGETDDEGLIEQPIPPDAKRGKLVISEKEEYPLLFGALDPVAEDSGVAERLVNLGYLDSEDRDDEEPFRVGVAAFQRKHGLTVTGVPDSETRQELADAHGC